MGKLWLAMACAIALGLGGCNDEGGDSGNAGTTGAVGGGVGGTTGGTTAGTTGGSAMTGGMGGGAGTMGGMTGGSPMTGGMGGTTGGAGGMGMTGGMGGMTGGAGGMGMTGGMGEMTGGMGGGEVTDTASCIAAATADGRTGACPECGCMKCLAEVMNCQDDACQSVVTCGQMNGCSGSACYCGDIDTITCVFMGAEGPCMNEIATASGLVGTTDTCPTNDGCASDLSTLADTDPNNPVQRARALSICTQGQPFAAATALTPEAPEIMGMCETECAAE